MSRWKRAMLLTTALALSGRRGAAPPPAAAAASASAASAAAAFALSLSTRARRSVPPAVGMGASAVPAGGEDGYRADDDAAAAAAAAAAEEEEEDDDDRRPAPTMMTMTRTTRRRRRGGKERRRSRSLPSHPPPDPSTFPDWAYGPRDCFDFEVIHRSSKSMARVGRLRTPHGSVDTPSYVAVATNAALKGLDMRDADASGQRLVFCNAYHLMLQPGVDVVEGAGGLHKFMNRGDGPIMTDSGGFQVFSLARDVDDGSTDRGGGELKRSAASRNARYRSDTSNASYSDGGPTVRVTEEGVTFKSYRDGRRITLTPESTVRAQKSLGADIIIPLDELPPYRTDRRRLEESVDRTHRWEARSLLEHLLDVRDQAMYCVIHGGTDLELRARSVECLTSLPFDGYAIGGSLGEDADEMLELLSWMMPLLEGGDRGAKPRHLLGIADERGVLGAVTNGVDTMDSCYPTRIGRHGTLLTRDGPINVGSGRYSRQYGVPIDAGCDCPTCGRHDRPYLWHLYKAKEPLFLQLAAAHNVRYMNDLMARHRRDIMDGKI